MSLYSAGCHGEQRQGIPIRQLRPRRRRGPVPRFGGDRDAANRIERRLHPERAQPSVPAKGLRGTPLVCREYSSFKT